MNKFLKLEFKRAMFSRKSLLTIMLILISVIIELIYGGDFVVNEGTDNAVFLMIKMLSIGMIGAFAFLIPIISVLPHGQSYVEDKNSGFFDFVITRIEKKKYIKVKMFVNAIVSGLICFCTLLIIYITLILVKGLPKPEIEHYLKPNGLFSNVAKEMPVLYPILVIIGITFFVICFSVFALGLSSYMNNKYLAIAIPTFIFYIAPIVTNIVGIGNYISFDFIHMIDIGYNQSVFNLIFIYLLLTISGVYMFSNNILNERNI